MIKKKTVNKTKATKAKRLARNRQYMTTTYRKKRRERYAKDEEYRTKVLIREREAYAKRKGMVAKDYGANAGSASVFASEKSIYPDTSSWDTSKRKVLTKPQMALFLGAGEKVFAGWVTSGKFPDPELWCVGDYYAYSISRANLLARALSKGLKGRGSFRNTDTALIEELSNL